MGATTRAWLDVAEALDARGARVDAGALRREVLEALGRAPDPETLAALVRACDARGERDVLDAIATRGLARGGARAALTEALGRAGDVEAVAALVRGAGEWQAAAATLRAGLAGLVAGGAPETTVDIEAQLLPIARGLAAAHHERWETARHAAAAAVHAEALIATALGLLGAEDRARTLADALLAAAPPRDTEPVARANRYAWCAAALAAAGDENAPALLLEADACIDRVDVDDDLDGYTAKFRQGIADARHRVQHLASMRGLPLGRRSLSPTTRQLPLSSSFRRFGEMDYGAERRAQLRVRIEGCAAVQNLGQALHVLAEAEACPDVDTYVRSELVALAAGAVAPGTPAAGREGLVAAAGRVPDLVGTRVPAMARSSALAAVAIALARAGHHDEALDAARRTSPEHRPGALARVALALFAAGRDVQVRAVLEEIGPVRAGGPSDEASYVAALVERLRR